MATKRRIRKTNDERESNAVKDMPFSVTDGEKAAILESIPDPVVLLDTDLKVVWANTAMIQLFNLNTDQLESWDCFAKMHGLKRPCRVCPVVGAINTGQPCTVDDFSSLGKRWRLRAYPLRDGEGNITRVVEIVTDITESKRAEDALNKTSKLQSLILDNSTVGIAFVRNRIYEWVNPKLCELYGIPKEQFIGSSTRIAYPDDESYQRIGNETYSLFAQGEKATFETLRRKGNGSLIWCKLEGIALDASKPQEGSIWIAEDITKRKQAEEALRKSETKYRRLHESMTEAFASVDMNGRIQESNRAYQSMLGYSEEDLRDLTYSDITPEKWHAFEKNIIEEQILVRGYAGIYEKEYQRKDGSVFPIELSTFLIRDDAGNPAGMWSIVRDITERKQMEEERSKIEARMREVQKLESLGVLAGGIAHDFNNLLMSILGRADLALFSLPQTSPAYQHVEEITRASHRAADLCRQMLAYSGKGRFVISRYDISEIVREMGQMLDVLISKNALMRYSLADGLPAVESDATQIRQVVMNLITNASDSLGDKQGIIAVMTGVMECDEAYLSESYMDDKLPGGTYVYLEVSDSGCGMDSETMSRIFDPFFSKKFTGRGLGLAAVLGIVRGHKGTIKVYSEVGKGTTFKILLPAVDWKPCERVKTAEETPSLKGGGTILLVDDDSYVREVASAMLTQLGFQVLTATNGRDGLNVFKTHGDEIACVILDLTMPEMGGEEAFTELRKLRNDIRVIMSSGYNEQDVIQRFVGRGLAGFVQKPYTMAGLRSALNRALG